MDVKEIRNKIITISGEPVTGKGTTVKALVEKLKQRGYDEESIHVITTGHEFRKYFNAIVECISNSMFISNLDNEEKLDEIVKTDEIRAIFNNPEYKKEFIKEIEMFKAKMQDPTCRTKLIERLRKQYKASKKLPGATLTIEEANNMPELNGIRGLVDKMIDENTRLIGERINQEDRPNEIWIIDSRLAFDKIPNSLSVRLTCRPDIAGKRLFEDKSRGQEDSGYENVEAAIKEREKRKNGEIKRYKERYGVDLTDDDNYKLIIDTSFSKIDDISDTILLCLDRHIEGKEFTKKWTSPVTLVGTQFVGETCSNSWGNIKNENGDIVAKRASFEDWIKFFKENNFNAAPEYALRVNEISGIRFLAFGDGHHRNFGMLAAGKTLVPYKVVPGEPEYQSKGIFNGVLDHEEIIQCYPKEFGFQDSIVNPNFKYSIIYENIKEVSNGLDEKYKNREEI